jgi:hypothetical protein
MTTTALLFPEMAHLHGCYCEIPKDIGNLRTAFLLFGYRLELETGWLLLLLLPMEFYNTHLSVT